MDKETLARNRADIVGLWRQVQRPGVDRLIEFLESSDFFIAPSSTQYHLAVEGGLAQHSLNVYNLLLCKATWYNGFGRGQITQESVIVCALGHDLCKVNFYKKGGEPCTDAQYQYLKSLITKWYPYIKELTDFFDDRGDVVRVSKDHAGILIDWLRNNPRSPMPAPTVEWAIKDELPLGHGEKSLSVLQEYIRLTDDEKLAIRWHMTAFDPSIHFDYPNGYAFREAAKRPLVALLFTADYEASQILEADINER